MIISKDQGVAITHLKIGVKIKNMTSQEILEHHNNYIYAQLECMRNYKHIGITIPPGQPQLEYFALGGYWTTRGEVLRFLINDDEHGNTIIEIDDREFNLAEFGKLLSVFAGWGMRIIIVPTDEISEQPIIKIKDPEQNQAQWDYLKNYARLKSIS